ncbi:MAG TPA: hypothetical protein VFK20_11590 [Vicinamibacterales bacterium]|nr:hypothetical protein [Vicinamibacterales bacterium]
MARLSKRSLEGELLIDHRNSPGLTPEDLAGFDAPAVAGGQTLESAIYVCGHCQYTVLKNPDRTRDREWCPGCDTYICDECAAVRRLTLSCNDVNRRIDAIGEALEQGVSPLLIGLKL